jgi:hypothetical protein
MKQEEVVRTAMHDTDVYGYKKASVAFFHAYSLNKVNSGSIQ